MSLTVPTIEYAIRIIAGMKKAKKKDAISRSTRNVGGLFTVVPSGIAAVGGFLNFDEIRLIPSNSAGTDSARHRFTAASSATLSDLKADMMNAMISEMIRKTIALSGILYSSGPEEIFGLKIL